MNLCSSSHDEICYEGHQCPFCAVVEEKDSEIADLRREVKSLENERNDLQEQLDAIPST